MSSPEATDKPSNSLDAIIELYKKDIDRSLLRENLKLAVHQRLDKFMRMMELHDELRRAGRRLRGQNSR